MKQFIGFIAVAVLAIAVYPFVKALCGVLYAIYAFGSSVA